MAAADDKVFGVGLLDGQHILYVVDLATERTVFQKPIAAAARSLKFGPDGKLYAFIGQVLTRIDPETFTLESLGSVEKAESFEFLGADLYLTGRNLRRIRNVIGAAP